MFRRTKERPRAPIAVRAILRPDACAGCIAERLAGDALLASLVGEAVTDPFARDELRATHGWCADHFERSVRIATADGARSAIAILYADLLRTLVAKGPSWPRPHPVCTICTHAAEVLPHAMRDVVVALERGEFTEQLAAAGALCLTHTSAVAALPRSPGRDRLLARGIAEMTQLAAALQDFADRQEHRSTDRADSAGSIDRLTRLVRGSEQTTSANRARR